MRSPCSCSCCRRTAALRRTKDCCRIDTSPPPSTRWPAWHCTRRRLSPTGRNCPRSAAWCRRSQRSSPRRRTLDHRHTPRRRSAGPPSTSQWRRTDRCPCSSSDRPAWCCTPRMRPRWQHRTPAFARCMPRQSSIRSGRIRRCTRSCLPRTAGQSRTQGHMRPRRHLRRLRRPLRHLLLPRRLRARRLLRHRASSSTRPGRTPRSTGASRPDTRRRRCRT